MMKITFQEHETKRFEDLRTGDIFTFNDKVFIKTDQRDDPPNRVKAVNLSTGEMFHFGVNVHVHPVEAELIVK